MHDEPLVLSPGEIRDLEERYPADEPLTKDEVRQFLRECVTVMKPGEVLVIRAWETWTVQQMKALQDVLNDMHKVGAVPFRSLVVPGAELGVAEAPDTGFLP